MQRHVGLVDSALALSGCECGGGDIGGSNTVALDNTGLAPLDLLSDC